MPTNPAWPALAVDDWTATRETLHMYTQIVGKVKMVLAAPVNHWWHVTLFVDARGLTTGAIPVGDRILELSFDFVEHVLIARTSDGRSETLPLGGSVARFYAEVMALLSRLDVDVRIHPVPNEVAEAIPFPDDTVHATYDAEHARLFWQQLVQADRVLRRSRSAFRGKVSPVHYFWGAMDLAVTRFSGRPAPAHPGGAPNCPDSVMVEGYSDELSSAGFWPGGGAEGAFYAYAYPAPEGYAAAEVPEEAYFDAALGEFLLPYEAVRRAPDPDALVGEFLRATAEAAARLADWPPAPQAPVVPADGASL
ncbi:DUF5996 family protein [Microbacterium sp. 8M]|uniref:DUF5996 family protein n=1 Tax=Microbacterium sp. 8M TaxID=2653153 RepID=UPI0013588D28|nr:DUF5996 family protein [Microbacterium sp. 8M]